MTNPAVAADYTRYLDETYAHSKARTQAPAQTSLLDDLKLGPAIDMDPAPQPGGAQEGDKTPAAAPQPSPAPVSVGTDQDEKRQREVGVYTRIEINPGDGSMPGATNYVDPASDTNLIVNRLIHRIEDGARGHDSVHLITGFGLNPMSASRAGAAFPETAVNLQAQGRIPPAAAQRNLNGVLIENINDGVWEAMSTIVDTDAIVRSLPPDLQPYGRQVLDDLDARTGYDINQPGIEPNSDFARQVGEIGGMGTVTPDLDNAGRQVYTPREDTIMVHDNNFQRLFTAFPTVRDELAHNLRAYVEYAAKVEKSMAETGQPPNIHPLEIVVSPETTQALMRTALVGRRKLQQDHPSSPAIPELINYYDSVLKRGDYGTPEVSKLPQSLPVA